MKKSNLRWIIVTLLFIATGLSFLDRQVLSVAIIKIQEEFQLTDIQYGMINTSFLIAYAIMFTVGGWLIDRLGAKTGLALSVGLWSVANALHGTVTGFYQLVAYRFLLGLGEGGCFPGAAKAVYDWFDEKERALANGIAIGGSAIGAVVAPPLTVWISDYFGWRGGFVIPGLAGILWVIIWLSIPWKKTVHRISQKRLPQSEIRKFPSIWKLLQNKAVWVFIIIRFLLDPVFYFFMFWIPKYLNEERDLSFESIGNVFWIPFLALGISNILGGWISDRLIKRYHFSVDRARKIVMGVAAVLTMVAPLVVWVESIEMAIFMMSIIMFAHGFWITNYITAISEMFGSVATATVVGLSGTGGAIAGLILNPVIGLVVQNYSYTPLWILSGLMYPLAFLLFILAIRKIRLLNLTIY